VILLIVRFLFNGFNPNFLKSNSSHLITIPLNKSGLVFLSNLYSIIFLQRGLPKVFSFALMLSRFLKENFVVILFIHFRTRFLIEGLDSNHKQLYYRYYISNYVNNSPPNNSFLKPKCYLLEFTALMFKMIFV
jgi:hypothetical protein